jgi:hypothetical protein
VQNSGSGRTWAVVEAVTLFWMTLTIQSWSPDYLKSVYVALLTFHYQWATIYLKAGNIEVAHATMLKVLESRCAYFGLAGRGILDTYYLMGIFEQKKKKYK